MIKITADSTCDLSPEIIESLGIQIVPLHIVVGDKTFDDGVNIKPEDIFRYTEEEGIHCKTAAANLFEYTNLFQELSSQYEAVIHINISSEFSSSHQNAKMAAAEFDNVYVVDSRNLSTGSGHLVMDAALMAKEGYSAEEICRKLEETAAKVEASFVIDKLDYLHKGGRCSGLEAFGAKLLQIKPCIEVVDGKMQVGKKYRGNLARCLDNYVKDRLSGRTDIDYSRIFITYSSIPEDVLEKVKESVASFGPFEEIIVTRAGCTITSHCGPNTLGILFKRKE
ncbi:hypothetical protein PRECH8_11650 [Insulibacter thermoxylanivorax]|uniref:EDD domain protein, DegV family n=1 Tax=Insulibacter thermoxylanivorax TaxID=2749268 RepID=A0A916QF97_9BACL|nr:DegV family protein [Insulibacter thermoxylanivorax]GFR37869.1 hypothetical protein PRECH8_11650 [Insulibacter thermoxylanivorax]